MIRPTVGLREIFFVCYNVYLKNKNHAINAPWNTLSKPQYTLKKTHHRIPSSIQFQETAVWLCDTTQYFFQECALNLCLGLMHLACVHLSMYCVIWFEKCVDVEFITNLILYHSSLFLNTNFDSKLLQSFRRKIALSRVQLVQPIINDKHKLNIEQMASSNSYLF